MGGHNANMNKSKVLNKDPYVNLHGDNGSIILKKDSELHTRVKNKKSGGLCDNLH